MTQWTSWIKSNEKEILSILNELACRAENAAKLLVDLFNDFQKLNENHVQIKKIEREADELYRKAVGELLETTDIINIIKLKDIYEALEEASDRCLDVADSIEDVVLKYT